MFLAHLVSVMFKELLLHGNRIGHLRQCERYLPYGLVTLTLASNNIADLNEISQLVHLINLNNFSITGNPCVCMVGNKVYPFRLIFQKRNILNSLSRSLIRFELHK